MAVKHLDLGEITIKELAALENEVETMKGLRHENIVGYLGFSESGEGEEGMGGEKIDESKIIEGGDDYSSPYVASERDCENENEERRGAKRRLS